MKAVRSDRWAERGGGDVAAPVSWGTTYVTITHFLPDGRPLLVAAGRVVPAGLALAGLAAVRTGWRPHGSEWWRTTVLATFNFAIFFPLLAVAVYRLPGGVAAAFGGLQPLFVLLLSRMVSGRRIAAAEVVVGAVAAAGVALVVLRPGAVIDLAGAAAAIGANLSFAMGVVLTKRFPAPADRVAATGWQLLVAGAVLVPLAVVVEGAPPAPTWSTLGGFAYLSLVATGLAFVVWFSGIRRLPTTAPPLLGLAAPVTGAALGWLVSGEDLSPLQLLGFAVTVGAIAYGTTRTRWARGPAAFPSASRHHPCLWHRLSRIPETIPESVRQ